MKKPTRIEYSTATPALSDAVHTPKDTQMMMNRGIKSAGMPDRIAEANSLKTKGVRFGCQPFRWLMMNTKISWVRPIKIPGTAPAMNRAPTDAPEIME